MYLPRRVPTSIRPPSRQQTGDVATLIHSEPHPNHVMQEVMLQCHVAQASGKAPFVPPLLDARLSLLNRRYSVTFKVCPTSISLLLTMC